MDPNLSHLKWLKSTRSGANNDDCVKVANLPGGGRAVLIKKCGRDVTPGLSQTLFTLVTALEV
ncbi:DUF397 domain-containing protein [Streptosporangium sp. NPDC006007]|uniref:DUF397 domain-containing protein n=1 Tax=Streptosporangium sp. NPDC006007 TaxID=3154575 RepID=UPI0033BDC3CD